MKTLVCVLAVGCAALVHGEAQVYDVSLTVNTTAVAQMKAKTGEHPFADQFNPADGKVYYRKSQKQTIKGVIWGCDCGTIVGVSPVEGGCVMWDAATKQVAFESGFNWSFVQAIGDKGTACEASWTLGDAEGENFLVGGGIGTLQFAKGKNASEDPCGNVWISSLSGNFGGWLAAPVWTIKGKKTKCAFCSGSEWEADTYIASEAWNICPCVETANATRTTAYGTWQIKYNRSASAKLLKTDNITEAYSFPKDVLKNVFR